ncbi:MAG TPA: 50S ribosomal protein L13 [Chloroflexota bacterium]|nr:50S ribosomal protein L13 [Chloroflexota bacterium]
MKTYSPKASEIVRQWHVIDASGQTLGRLATEIAQLLKGKNKVIYAPHMDTGDFVIVVNASKVRVTGDKLAEKKYYRHSGYPGGLTAVSLASQLEKFPERVVEHAVRGMLPHNALGRAMYRKLKVYGGPTHPHASQLTKQEQPSA